MKKIYRFFVGTYTDDTESKGIYRLTFDAGQKTFSVEEAASLRNPSCLCAISSILYAGSEFKDGASVTAYRQEGGYLYLVAHKELDGSLLCHISSSKAADYIFASCLLSGNSFILRPDGLDVLSELSMTARTDKAPLAHCAACTDDGRTQAVTDMGGDRIYMRSLLDGAIDKPPSPVAHDLEPNTGPRHLAFHPSRDMLYISNELNSTISVFSFKHGENSLKLLQNLAAGEAREGIRNYPSAITVTNDGRYVIISNRGLDTVCVFSVSSGGLLEKAGEYPCYGKWPRHIALTDDTQYIVISNQYSSNVAICRFDLTDGSIQPPVCVADIPAPSCVVEA